MSKKQKRKISVGQIYKLWFNKEDEYEDKHHLIILVLSDYDTVIAVSLTDNDKIGQNKPCRFTRWTTPITVRDPWNITQEEFKEITNNRKTKFLPKRNITLKSVV